MNHYLDGIKGTVFRQTQFAEFEHWTHETAAEGTPLTVDFLSDKYAKINSSNFPIEVMKTAGVDMTNRDYIDRAMKVF